MGAAGVASNSGGGEGGAAGQGAAQGQEGEYTAAEWAECNEWVRATEERFNALRGQLEEQEARTRDMVEVTEMRGRCEGRNWLVSDFAAGKQKIEQRQRRWDEAVKRARLEDAARKNRELCRFTEI